MVNFKLIGPVVFFMMIAQILAQGTATNAYIIIYEVEVTGSNTPETHHQVVSEDTWHKFLETSKAELGVSSAPREYLVHQIGSGHIIEVKDTKGVEKSKVKQRFEEMKKWAKKESKIMTTFTTLTLLALMMLISQISAMPDSFTITYKLSVNDGTTYTGYDVVPKATGETLLQNVKTARQSSRMPSEYSIRQSDIGDVIEVMDDTGVPSTERADELIKLRSWVRDMCTPPVRSRILRRRAYVEEGV
ncbi:hypothetical protein ANO11243_087300 [Dothideomycetidae sp. 11243]|nr:hypothetical protein ANO11243_087300 [fungal sp. No.11243]